MNRGVHIVSRGLQKGTRAERRIWGIPKAFFKRKKKNSFVLLVVQARKRELEMVVCSLRGTLGGRGKTGEKVFKLGAPAGLLI